MVDDPKSIDNSYEARLKRLKDELNRPTVTEIIQMHKMQNKNHVLQHNQHNDIIELTPFHLVNTTANSFEKER